MELSWEKVYDYWRFSFQDLGLSGESLFDFSQVYVDRFPYYLHSIGLDWWSISEYQGRLDSLVNNGNTSLLYWETRKGTLHTVQELWEYREDKERQTAVWMMATLWDKKKELPESWRGQTFQLIDDLFRLIHKRFPEISHWHHAARSALPFSIVGDYRLGKTIRPEELNDLIHLLVLEAGVINGNWKLVRFLLK